MRFINNRVRDAFFAQKRPNKLKFEAETFDAAVAYGKTLSDAQLAGLADYMCLLTRLRQEEQEWFFQRGWIEAEKQAKAVKTP